MPAPSFNPRCFVPRRLQLATATGLCTTLWLTAACAPRPADPEPPVKTAAPAPAPEPEPPAKDDDAGEDTGHKRLIVIRENNGNNINTSIDPSHAARVVRAHAFEVTKCYQLTLARHPGLSGTIRMRFRIASSGRVIDCQSSEDLPNPEVGRCICERSRQWRFELTNEHDVYRFFEHVWRFEP